jgi:UNC-50 family
MTHPVWGKPNPRGLGRPAVRLLVEVVLAPGGLVVLGVQVLGVERMSSSLPLYVKRLFKFSQLDFEVSIWEMLTLMYNPRRVYKQIYYHVPQPSKSRANP